MRRHSDHKHRKNKLVNSTEMSSKEKNIKSALIKTTNSIRKKYKNFYKTRVENQEHLKELYKPITTSIDKINLYNNNNKNVENNKKKVKFDFSTPNTPKSRRRLFNDESEWFSDYDTADSINSNENNNNNSDEDNEDHNNHNLNNSSQTKTIRAYLLSSPSFTSPTYDNIYGVRKDGDKYKIGNTEVTFDSSDIIINGDKFKFSKGLYDLLFRVKPDTQHQTETDLNQYKEILKKTSAHKVNYDAKSRMRHSNTHKYINIIKPMFAKRGSGLLDYMQVNNNKIDYKYWDDPNELVNRLRLLISSKAAGHTGHDNEIISIIEELKEANFII